MLAGIFILTCHRGGVIFENEQNRFWVSLYDGGFGRISVPLFIIISAYLLVPMKKGTSMFDFYKKRLLRVLPPFVFFQIVYSVVPNIDGSPLEFCLNRIMYDLKQIPFNFNQHAYHLWFMFPLISIYLFIPIISPWLEKVKPKEELTFICFFFISTFIPWLHRFVSHTIWGESWWNGFHMLWYFSGYIGYVVLAHYIRFHIKWSTVKCCTVGLMTFLGGGLFTGWSIWIKGRVGVPVEQHMMQWAMEYCTPNVFCATFGAFLLFSRIKNNMSLTLITEISKLSFGMYLIHLLLLPLVIYIFRYLNNNIIIPVAFAIPIEAIFTFVLCALSCKLLSYLPFSKFLLGI